eukprot:13983162-Alexandrium_andersonii.AAC.1
MCIRDSSWWGVGAGPTTWRGPSALAWPLLRARPGGPLVPLLSASGDQSKGSSWPWLSGRRRP